MIAKLMPDNHLALPQQALEALGRPTHFEVSVEEGRLVLTPAPPPSADDIRRELEDLGLTEQDVADAVAWARRGG